ncbi:hypothetical protein BHM03_00052220, partial [Ensete ventricosum]
DVKALQALEVMKSCHDFDSTMSLESLAMVRKRFNIPNEYVLHAPGSGQRPYHPCLEGFNISIDALEAGLRFPLHLCKGSGIVLTQYLFLSCFRLCKGQGGYYLTSRVGFRVGGAPSNNKGWKARFLFVSRSWGWGFGVNWSTHSISNVPPNLSDEESILIGQLKGILSASRAIKNLTEWLVEAGLSPPSRGMP